MDHSTNSHICVSAQKRSTDDTFGSAPLNERSLPIHMSWKSLPFTQAKSSQQKEVVVLVCIYLVSVLALPNLAAPGDRINYWTGVRPSTRFIIAET